MAFGASTVVYPAVIHTAFFLKSSSRAIQKICFLSSRSHFVKKIQVCNFIDVFL